MCITYDYEELIDHLYTKTSLCSCEIKAHKKVSFKQDSNPCHQYATGAVLYQLSLLLLLLSLDKR